LNLDLNRLISVLESKIQRNKYWVIACYFEWICLINFSLTKNVQYLTYTTKISNKPWHFHHATFNYNTNFHFSVEYVIVSFLVWVCRFKSRFLIFKSAPPFPYKTQTEIVLACVGLHNFLRKFCRTDNFSEEKDFEDVEDVEEVNNNDEEILVTQDQQREHANQVRATIATDMWRDFINVWYMNVFYFLYTLFYYKAEFIANPFDWF